MIFWEMTLNFSGTLSNCVYVRLKRENVEGKKDTHSIQWMNDPRLSLPLNGKCFFRDKSSQDTAWAGTLGYNLEIHISKRQANWDF